MASRRDDRMAKQRDDGDRNSGGPIHGGVQHCSGLDEAGQSGGDDQLWSDGDRNRELWSARRFFAGDHQSSGRH